MHLCKENLKLKKSKPLNANCRFSIRGYLQFTDFRGSRKHIKEKKHLPEIASAKEMEKEGVNVGEFQIKLLHKIEELTLYAIEQNKQIKKMSEENKVLHQQSQKIKQLEEQLKSIMTILSKL